MVVDTPDAAAFGTVACGICQTREAVWVHTLDLHLAQFRIFGKDHSWGSPVSLCDPCHWSLRAADVEALVAADPSTDGLDATNLDERVRSGLRALVAADLGSTAIDSARPAGYRDLIDEGFTPLENITGALFLAHAWPEIHRRALAPINPEATEYLPDGTHWFVQSPWPSIALRDVFDLVMSTLDEAFSATPPRHDEEQLTEQVRDLLACQEADIKRRLGA